MAATNGLRRGRSIGPPTFLTLLLGCTSVDPGPNFVVPQTVFDADYFYCHVEPEFIFAYSCGSGDPSKDKPEQLPLQPLRGQRDGAPRSPGRRLRWGRPPRDLTQIGTGSPAQNNLESVSLEMSNDYTTAALFVRPSNVTGDPPSAHPRVVFDQDDQTVNELLRTWASK